MPDNFLGIATHPGIELAFRLGAYLIAASLLSLLAVRLAMSLVSTVKVKARRQWDVQPAADGHQSLIARLLGGCEQELASQDLLNDDVKRMLEQRAKLAPSSTEVHTSGTHA